MWVTSWLSSVACSGVVMLVLRVMLFICPDICLSPVAEAEGAADSRGNAALQTHRNSLTDAIRLEANDGAPSPAHHPTKHCRPRSPTFNPRSSTSAFLLRRTAMVPLSVSAENAGSCCLSPTVDLRECSFPKNCLHVKSTRVSGVYPNVISLPFLKKNPQQTGQADWFIATQNHSFVLLNYIWKNPSSFKI